MHAMLMSIVSVATKNYSFDSSFPYSTVARMEAQNRSLIVLHLFVRSYVAVLKAKPWKVIETRYERVMLGGV